MRVRVLLFAGLRERLARAHVDLDLPDGATVGAATEALRALHSELAGRTFSVALNRRYARVDAALAEGDELALIPPVSGG